MTVKNLNIKPLTRALEIRSNTFQPDSLEFDMVFSSGAAVMRQSDSYGPYYEELSLDPLHVRLGRLNNGAPLLNAHSLYNLSDVLGVIIYASVDGKIGTARARLSSRDEVKSIATDIKDGILKNNSVGYRVYQYRDITQPGDQYTRLLAIDWEPFEISIVPVGADDNAMMRSDKIESNECKILNNKNEGTNMPPEILKTEKIDQAKIASEAIAGEKKRILEIRSTCKRAGLSDDFAETLIEQSVDIDQARAKIIDAVADKKEQGKDAVSANPVLGSNRDTKNFKEGVANAILSRYFPSTYKVSDEGKKFRHMSLMDMSRYLIELKNGGRSFSLTNDEIIQRAFHTTSDFVEILSDVANISLRDGYSYAEPTFTPFVRKVEVKDFKSNKSVLLGEAPELLLVGESGEITAGTIAESSESYAVKSYARKVLVTRQIIINDNIKAFTDVPFKAGLQTRNLESNLVYSQLTSNPVMSDGVALFHASHNNLMSASVIDEGSLSLAKKAIKTQKGLDGRTALDLIPQYIITPVGLEDRAAQYVTNLQGSQLYASSTSNVNVHKGKYTVISDSRLDTASATAWYMSCAVGMIDIIELGYMQGQEGGPVVSVTEKPGEGVEFSYYADRGAKVIDHRGIVKNPGA